jgi:hypothetical protein
VQHTFTISEYYKILGLPADSSVDEIKKAYRKKARLYHPDVNHSPDAKDIFIRVTEAYEFLLQYHEKLRNGDEEYKRVMEEWKRYRQNRVRMRAKFYAGTSYGTFKNTRFYRSTKIFDRTTIIFSLAISIIVLIYTVFGYIFRLRHPIPGLDKPSILSFIMLLLLSLVFLGVSFIYLKAYLETYSRKKKPGKKS